MTDQLPIISGTRAINASATTSTSLLRRGLAAIQSQKIVTVEQDIRYRQARDIYNRITDYGWESRFEANLLPKRGEQFDLFEDNQLLQLQLFFTKLQQLADTFIVFHQLADKGYGKAYFPLARMYWGGQGITKNIEKNDFYSYLAFDWCFSNKTLNDPEIWMDLGWMYEDGRGVEQDDEAAVFWYEQAVGQGHAIAQCNLGWMYEYGRGVKQDDEQAVFWYEQAAGQGHARAQCNLGGIYQYGRGVEQDDEQAVFWYEQAAGQGYASAQCNLGWMYQYGRGVEQDDEPAVFCYEQAAGQGHVRAQFNLGWMYQYGRGIEQDDEQAVFWYEQAADQGYAQAQFNLGWMYQYGRGIEQDDEQAVELYRKAAKQGHANA